MTAVAKVESVEICNWYEAAPGGERQMKVALIRTAVAWSEGAISIGGDGTVREVSMRCTARFV